jgi:hypothetical protein
MFISGYCIYWIFFMSDNRTQQYPQFGGGQGERTHANSSLNGPWPRSATNNQLVLFHRGFYNSLPPNPTSLSSVTSMISENQYTNSGNHVCCEFHNILLSFHDHHASCAAEPGAVHVQATSSPRLIMNPFSLAATNACSTIVTEFSSSTAAESDSSAANNVRVFFER